MTFLLRESFLASEIGVPEVPTRNAHHKCTRTFRISLKVIVIGQIIGLRAKICQSLSASIKLSETKK